MMPKVALRGRILGGRDHRPYAAAECCRTDHVQNIDRHCRKYRG